MAFRPGLRPLTPTPGASGTLGLGCAPIGNLYTAVAEADAVATVERALDRGIRFVDTAPHYGAGASEQRLGRALAGVPRDSVAIATKVGRRIVDADGRDVAVGDVGTGTVGDLSRDGVLRSLEGSLARLGTDRIDLLHLHDPEDVEEALRTAIPALVELRDQGVVRAIGVGMVWNEPLARFVREAPVDVVMIAGRTTLLDRTAEADLLPAARAHGVGIIAAGVFNSGILADPEGAPYFDYKPAATELVERARRLDAACAAHGVALRHAAARFPLRRPPVEAVVIGARTPAEVDDFVDGAAAPIPDALWDELERA
ncbi:aldo/keto reductase [Microbacterium sp. M3]|uniref:Aldo/keto reductase n=1 Tax=Microbacterium arthrosphaerae TaxID=792652 RepID=A0ABU4H4F9_9MICO|nr:MULTISPECIES: aldo/keto reductase [Microbacterium]MDW4574221.1 aldo/keto reductase [Microbacterium arthrosphaerae]MDW7608076.1 aldo/keto reductase [Microbacterium sp. M3]